MIIYMIQNKLNGKMYIGQTRRPLKERINQHKLDAENGVGFELHNSIRKHGWDNFEVTILDETDNIDKLNELEEYYISKYDSINKGYNLALGGKNNTMDSPKIRKHHDEIMRNDDVRNKISNTMKAKLSDPEIKKSYTERLMKGFKNYAKTDKFKEDQKNRHLSVEHSYKLNSAKYKKVYCVDKNNEFVAEFKCVKDAAYWWYNHGYSDVSNYLFLYDPIKKSSKENIFIKGLKWIYRV